MAFDFSTAGNIKLFNTMMPLDQVTFDLNPDSFKISKGTLHRERGSSGGGQSSPTGAPSGYTSYWLRTDPTKVVFTALLSDDSSDVADEIADVTALGGGIKARCDLLFNWTQPGGGSLLGLAVSAAASLLGFRFQRTVRQPLLTLQWGDPGRGFLMQGYLEDVSIDYNRFDFMGNSIRAKVTCTFHEAPNTLLSMLTNPTSGGVPGRRTHVLTEGETLPALAAATYGRPQAWREIAEANGIDDPLRVRPGRRVALPPPAEVGS
jgi:hypothetical protein